MGVITKPDISKQLQRKYAVLAPQLKPQVTKIEDVVQMLNNWIESRPWISRLPMYHPLNLMNSPIFYVFNNKVINSKFIACNWLKYDLKLIGTKEQLLSKIQSKLIGEHIYDIAFDDGDEYSYHESEDTWKFNYNNKTSIISTGTLNIQPSFVSNTFNFGALEISVDDNDNVKILNKATNKSKIIKLDDDNNSLWNSMKNMLLQIKISIKNLFRSTK